MFACHQYAYPQNAAGPGAEGAPWSQSAFRRGPPPIVAILGVGAAFMVFPPLGLAALAFVLWRARHGGAWRRQASAGSTAPCARRTDEPQQRLRGAPPRHDEPARRGSRGLGGIRTASEPSARSRGLRSLHGRTRRQAGRGEAGRRPAVGLSAPLRRDEGRRSRNARAPACGKSRDGGSGYAMLQPVSAIPAAEA